MKSWLPLMLSGLLVLAGCVEPYKPEVISRAVNYLVVDGFINADGPTIIRLSRTTTLESNKPVPVESRASVYIEEESGARYPLSEGDAGTYTSSPLHLSSGRRVRLYIKTAGPKEYASDFVVVKQTPPIDSVSWRANGRGLQLYVSTHDNTDQARYYRWEFEDTWQFTSARATLYEYRNNQLVPRREDIYHCWRTEKSPSVKTGNTRRLAHDVLTEAPLTLIPANAERLRYKYSILVRQYALTEEENSYWEMLNKNSESLGTVFGPLPSQIDGNLHCLSDADETVIGFVGAQSVTEKRLFVERRQLPGNWYAVTPYDNCTVYDTIPDPVTGQPRPLDHFRSAQFLPVELLPDGLTYLSSSAECLDCRKRGTNVRPSFWQ